MSNEKFYYYNPTDIGGYDVAKTDQNLLKIKEIDLLFFQYSTGPGVPGKCLYGKINVDKCERYNISTSSSTISFNPLVKTDKLVYMSYGKELNFISLDSVDAPQIFNLENNVINAAANGASMLYRIGLTDNSAYDLKLLLGAFPNVDPLEQTDSMTKADAINSSWTAQLFSLVPAATLSQVGPYLHSKVTYSVGGQPVTYWGAKLPRIKAGAVVNPVAKVQGNVYMTDFAQKSTDVPLKSLGNISSNLRREAVVRNVAKYLTGFSGTISSGDKTVTTGSAASIGGLTELVTDKVFYVKDGDLTIDCGGTDCTFDKTVAFIVENGNIKVNSNILTTNNAQVGLIALRNLVGNVQDEGHLYLYKDVTWLSGVQIYLDRVLQSYDTIGAGFDLNGFFKQDPVADDYARQQKFGSQLVLEGTISSMNGIGNASRAIPTDENGNPLTGGNYCPNYQILTGICRARVVDLNYLRYYGPGLELCDGTEGPGAQLNAPRDQFLKNSGTDPDFGCNPAAVGYDIDAEGLYDAATATNYDLVAGKLSPGGLRSQYFISKGLPVTLANEYPVNFFYKPIAKDLPGFEVEQNFNPIIQ